MSGNAMKNASKIMQTKHTVNKAAKVAGDVARAASNIPGKAGKVAKVAGKVADMVYNITQHEEWYTKYLTSDLTINLNYGARSDIPVYTGYEGTNDYYVPTVMSISIANEIPHSRLSYTDPLTVDMGWQQGIANMFSSTRSANSSTPPYNEDALEKYTVNTTALHVAYSFLRKAYATLRNFSAYDGRMPRILFKAMNLDYDSFMSHAADLKMYGNMMGLEIASKYPLNIPLIERKRWMFSNFFADSNTSKHSLYSFDGIANGYVLYVDGSTYKRFSLPNQDTALTYEEVIAAIDSLRDVIAKHNYNAYIASELLKAFGEKMIYPAEVWADDMAAPIVYDEAALRQIENAWSIMPLGASQQGKDLPASVTNPTFTFTDGGFDSTQEGVLVSIIDNMYINTHNEVMSTGKTLSAMRLTTKYDARGVGNVVTAYCLAYNTEIPMHYSIYASLNEYDNDVINIDNLIAGPIVQGALTWEMSKSARTTFNVAAFARSPRFARLAYMPWLTDQTQPGVDNTNRAAFLYNLWDWTNYAEGPTVSSFVSFSSLANMSLLYVDKIIPQSKWEAVDLNTGKTTKGRGFSNK